jgi:hypothetical protein
MHVFKTLPNMVCQNGQEKLPREELVRAVWKSDAVTGICPHHIHWTE